MRGVLCGFSFWFASDFGQFCRHLPLPVVRRALDRAARATTSRGRSQRRTPRRSQRGSRTPGSRASPQSHEHIGHRERLDRKQHDGDRQARRVPAQLLVHRLDTPVPGLAVQELAPNMQAKHTNEAKRATPGLRKAVRSSALRRLGRPLLTAYGALLAVAVLVVAGCLLLMWR
jgi:hypothetical protein